jgi:hypothetical protein
MMQRPDANEKARNKIKNGNLNVQIEFNHWGGITRLENKRSHQIIINIKFGSAEEEVEAFPTF